MPLPSQTVLNRRPGTLMRLHDGRIEIREASPEMQRISDSTIGHVVREMKAEQEHQLAEACPTCRYRHAPDGACLVPRVVPAGSTGADLKTFQQMRASGSRANARKAASAAERHFAFGRMGDKARKGAARRWGRRG
jgi:hypothetical protein